jgi:hypothetical protein
MAADLARFASSADTAGAAEPQALRTYVSTAATWASSSCQP